MKVSTGFTTTSTTRQLPGKMLSMIFVQQIFCRGLPYGGMDPRALHPNYQLGFFFPCGWGFSWLLSAEDFLKEFGVYPVCLNKSI
jgi:hypothetical protein